MLATSAITFALLFLPVLWIAIDLAAYSRARRGPSVRSIAAGTGSHEFVLLVPIYGSMKYLENFEFLEPYGQRVVLCTTSTETPEFYDQLSEVAARGGFQILIAGDLPTTVTHPEGVDAAKRSTGGAKRDTVIRAALEQVDAEFVVCIDADTSTSESIDALVAEFAARDLDFASIQLVVSNRRESLFTRLQAHEYALAMKLRSVLPWLVSGACHIGRTTVHREVMRRHSLFFQGNDVETGLLAEQLGYRVGHIRFEVPTVVPAKFRALVRQRYAWVGGEFRLFAVNFRYACRHPLFYAYGLIFVIVLFPLRWLALTETPATTLLGLFAVYVTAITALCWRGRDLALLLMPFYTLMSTLLIVPLGALSYFQMARVLRNPGVIRLSESSERLADVRSLVFEANAFRRWLQLQTTPAAVV